LSAFDSESRAWLTLHSNGVSDEDADRIRFDSPCKQLVFGQCEIYETRPRMCRADEPGSAMCMEAIRVVQPHMMKTIEEHFTR